MIISKRPNNKIRKNFAVLERLSQIVVPDFSTMKLENLFDLRKDKAIESFRGLITKIGSNLQSDSKLEIEGLFMEELLKEIEEIAPSKKGFLLEASLGALSFIPIPLVGIGTTVAGLGKELKEIRDFSKNWLSFILRTTKKPQGECK